MPAEATNSRTLTIALSAADGVEYGQSTLAMLRVGRTMNNLGW
jgi:hypothetical protein